MARRLSFAIPALALVAAVWLVGAQAYHAPTQPVDEPLWFQRSILSPWHVSGDGRFWGIDVPAVNRWAWWLALRATGRNRIPRDEPQAFYLDDEGRMLFQGRRCRPNWLPQAGGLAAWMVRHGAYAPRVAIVTMRQVNVGWYTLMLGSLWYAAYAALHRPALAALCVLPVAVNPLFTMNVAFTLQSGDIQMCALSAAMLALWLGLHNRGIAAQPKAIIALGLVAGLVVAAKQTGVLCLAAYALWLAGASHGWRRLLNPIVAAGTAFVVFSALNPVVYLCPGENPVGICMEMVERRAAVVAGRLRVYGPASWTQLTADYLYWWPLVPVLGAVAWRKRREAWFWPVALWAGLLIGGTLVGVFEARMSYGHYRAPLELALWWSMAVGICAGARGST